jgi:hypothetical protein
MVMLLTPAPVRRRRTNQDRLRSAKRRREALVALLCAWEYEVHAAERLAAGIDPDPLPGPGYGRCAKCNCYRSLDLLEVDHVDGCAWDKRKVNAWTRAARYWRELKNGVRLRALCRGCNASDGSIRFRRRGFE